MKLSANCKKRKSQLSWLQVPCLLRRDSWLQRISRQTNERFIYEFLKFINTRLFSIRQRSADFHSASLKRRQVKNHPLSLSPTPRHVNSLRRLPRELLHTPLPPRLSPLADQTWLARNCPAAALGSPRVNFKCTLSSADIQRKIVRSSCVR